MVGEKWLETRRREQCLGSEINHPDVVELVPWYLRDPLIEQRPEVIEGISG